MSVSELLGSVTGLVAATRRGEVSCTEVARVVLERIEALDGGLRAFTAVDPDRLLDQAGALDRRDRPGPALLGLPVGIKDVFDTSDLPTEYGSPYYRGHRPIRDAAVVARFASEGALVAGKTKTTEYACVHPTDTRNPIDRRRTPGGSSSGSAAAVGAGMVPVATGTQTAGSTIRPGSFCGVVALKPTFGVLPRGGVKPLSESLDTVGLFARTVEDVAFVLGALVGSGRQGRLRDATDRSTDATVLDDGYWRRFSRGGPRLAYMRTDRWSQVASEARDTLDGLAIQADLGGAEIVEVEPPRPTAELDAAAQTIMLFEMARALGPELAIGGEAASDELADFLAAARDIDVGRYLASRALAERARWEYDQLLRTVDACLTPSTVDVPPVGLESTGDARFCRPWTMLGVPCVAVPAAWSDAGLPFGVQLVGRLYRDDTVLAAAHWVEQLTQASRPAPSADIDGRQQSALPQQSETGSR